MLGREGYWEACGYRQSLVISDSLIRVLLDWEFSPSCSLQLKFSTGPLGAELRPVGRSSKEACFGFQESHCQDSWRVAGRVRSWLLPSLWFWPHGDLSLALEVWMAARFQPGSGEQGM